MARSQRPRRLTRRQVRRFSSTVTNANDLSQEEVVKKHLAVYIAAVILLATLSIPSGLIAHNDQHSKHHHYQLVDLGALGGTQSFFSPGSGFAFGQHIAALNAEGRVAGYADTSNADPFQNYCFSSDCLATHTFLSNRSGVLTDLGALPGGGNSVPNWISANGLIAGLSENGETDPLYMGLPQLRAVLWRNGNIIDLKTLPEGGYQSEANSVNSSGHVVGAALNTVPDDNSMQVENFWLWGGDGGITPPYPYQTRAFVWDSERGMRDLGTLGGTDAQALIINERGQVLGHSYIGPAASPSCPYPLVTDSFLWEKGKGMEDLGTLGGTCTTGLDLNQEGQVVGGSNLAGDELSHAFLWSHGHIHDLGGSLGGSFTGAFAINEQGEAVGFAYYPDNTTFHAVLWRAIGHMTNLGVIGDDQCSYSAAINASEQVVGSSISSCTADEPTFRAFLWEDGVMLDLNNLIPTGSPLYLQVVQTINDRGEIAGQGADSSGNNHAFLLIPCDENHPDVEDCDYSLVDGPAATSSHPAPVVQSPASAIQSSPVADFRLRIGFGHVIRSPRASLGKTAASAATATLSLTSLTYSTQAIGTTSAAKTVTLKNAGTVSLTISKITITGTNAGDFSESTTCGTSLAAGTSCKISVRFKPTEPGMRAASLRITDNTSASPQEVALSGTGTTAKLSHTSLNFGFVEPGRVSEPKTVILTNVGAATLTIAGVAITGTNVSDFAETHTCGSSLAAGASCRISVTFQPTASGDRTAVVTVTDNAFASPQEVALSGTGAPSGTGNLTGYCLHGGLECTGNYDPAECTPGAIAIDPGNVQCGFPTSRAPVDVARSCESHTGFCSRTGIVFPRSIDKKEREIAF